MKKALLILILCFAYNSYAQTSTPYLNTPFSLNNLTVIKDQVKSTIDSSYNLTSIYYKAGVSQASINYVTADGSKFTVTANERSANGIIDNIAFDGTFKTVYEFYKKQFNTSLSADAIKAKGYATPIIRTENGQKISISFTKYPYKQGYWEVWVRKI